MAALNVTCSMAAQHDWVLAELARLMGAWRSWVVCASIDDIEWAVSDASGGACERIPVLSGQPLAASDVRSLAKGERSGLLACDSTLASGALCAPCSLGADIALERLDLLVGREGTEFVAIGLARDCPERESIADALDAFAGDPAHALQPWEPELLAGRLEGFEDRVRRGADRAQELACYLECHPKVEGVAYPGLKSDPSFAAASTNFHHGFGVYVDYRAAGEWRRVSSLDGQGRVLPLAELIADMEGILSQLRPLLP